MIVNNVTIKSEGMINKVLEKVEELKTFVRKMRMEHEEFGVIYQKVEDLGKLIEKVKKGERTFTITMMTKLSLSIVFERATKNNILIVSHSESGFLSKKTTLTAEGSFDNIRNFQREIKECECVQENNPV